MPSQPFSSDHKPSTESPAALTDAEHQAQMVELKQQQDALVKSKQLERGIILVNTGDGKGKSTAAFGLAIRAAGSGLRVGIIQFIKGTWRTGEEAAFKRFPEIEHVVSGEGFTWNTQDRQKDIAAVRRGWERAKEMIESSRSDEPSFHLLVLDELNIALAFDYISLDEVLPVLQNKPEQLNIAITGRDAKPELIAIADTVTDMKSIKHAFDAGIIAQRGIEF